MKRKVGVAIAIALPTIVTWLYFVLLKDQPTLQKAAFGLKVLQFGFPLLWIVWQLNERWKASGLESKSGESKLGPSLSHRNSMIFGVVLGIAVVAAMLFLYQTLGEDDLSKLSKQATDKVQEMELDSAWKFIGLGMFYAMVHSFLEEYYFRWFIFGQLRRVTKFVPAMIISGLAFMAHHVIILLIYFQSNLLLAIFLSLSIAVGGMIWAWQYEKSQSLIGPWVSHMIVDAGIFYVGFHLLRGAGVL